MKDASDLQRHLTLMWDVASGLSKNPLPALYDPQTHIERRGAVVVGYIFDQGVLIRTVSGLTRFSVQHRIDVLLGRK